VLGQREGNLERGRKTENVSDLIDVINGYNPTVKKHPRPASRGPYTLELYLDLGLDPQVINLFLKFEIFFLY
jgi:hypothetical protein